ncbi:MAG: AsmA family protein [Alphaproteobacteria bacterium]
MAKKIWIALSLILVTAIVGVSVYVSTIDWNQHKDKIAAQFTEVTGKRVVFEGPVTFSLFPSPYLTASNIKVYNMSGAPSPKPLATIKSLIANLSLIPLLNGDFEVKMMSLVEPEIFFEVQPDGSVNWYSPLTETQRDNMENVNLSLDSVLLEKARVNIVDAKHNVESSLDNLNAEVIAYSVYGPYRIEGSYVRGKNPEGFAISLGQFSESFATSVNLVLNQPAAKTYLRFDGSVLLQNDAVNGNVIFESNDLTKFVNDSLWGITLDKVYDHPLAVSFELNTNKTKIDLSNIVVKYGTTAGAGNMLIPLLENEFKSDTDENVPERRRIEMAFDMTDLELEPVVHTLAQVLDKYAVPGTEYNPQYNFDVLADVKAVKSYYNDQTIRDFNLSLDFIDNNLTIKNLTATLPGETTSGLKGDIFSADEALSYNLDVSLATNDFEKTANWLGAEIKPIVTATYKKAVVTANLSGTLKTIKVSPFDITLDKTAMKGDLGIVRGDRNSAYLVVNADSINFDNYISGLPNEERAKSFAERTAYRFGKLAFLNDFDLHLNSKLGLGIYENIPFENIQFDMELNKGIMNIQALNIGSLANSTLKAEGKIKGFGERPQFDNIKYDLDTPDLTNLLNKFDFSQPPLNNKDLRKLSSKGIFSGFLDRIAIKAVSKYGYIDSIYTGELARKNDKFSYKGLLDLKVPDFVKFVNDLGFNYAPKAYSLGIFTFKSQVNGDADKFKLSDIDVFVGANNFKGEAVFDRSGGRPNVTADMKINTLELERYFYNGGGQSVQISSFRPNAVEDADFIAKPYFDKAKFDFGFYNSFDFQGKFDFGRLSYKNNELQNALMNLSLKDGVLNMNQLTGTYKGEPVTASWKWGMSKNPYLKGNLEVKNQVLSEGVLSGKKYGIRSGKIDLKTSFDTSASSFEDMFLGLNSTTEFVINSPIVKGWDMAAIREDLSKREYSEGLAAEINADLEKGETPFDVVKGTLKTQKANYSFEQTVFAGKDLLIEMDDTGNLDTWDMDGKFTVKMAGLKNIPPFTFTMTGAMIAPQTAADVAPIANVYDSKWAKVAADKKAAEEARAAFLKGLMDEQLNKARTVKQQLDEEVLPEYEAMRALATDAGILKQYDAIKAEIEKTDAGLGELFTLGLTKDFDEKLPESMDKKREVYAKSIEKMKGDIATAYANDIKLRINGTYNQIVDVYNKSKDKSISYRDRFVEFPKRMANVKTEYVMDEDEQINQLKESIEEKLLSIDTINNEVVKDYIFIQNTQDKQRLEEYAARTKELLAKAEIDIKDLDSSIENLFAYTEERVAAEEKIYQDKLKAEEIKRKLEENVGKISGAKGQTKTVVRDIEEIEKSEEAREKEKVKVLDFSGEAKSVNVIKKPDAAVEIKEEAAPEKKEETTGIIRKVTGTISKASGTIKKQ